MSRSLLVAAVCAATLVVPFAASAAPLRFLVNDVADGAREGYTDTADVVPNAGTQPGEIGLRQERGGATIADASATGSFYSSWLRNIKLQSGDQLVAFTIATGAELSRFTVPAKPLDPATTCVGAKVTSGPGGASFSRVLAYRYVPRPSRVGSPGGFTKRLEPKEENKAVVTAAAAPATGFRATFERALEAGTYVSTEIEAQAPDGSTGQFIYEWPVASKCRAPGFTLTPGAKANTKLKGKKLKALRKSGATISFTSVYDGSVTATFALRSKKSAKKTKVLIKRTVKVIGGQPTVIKIKLPKAAAKKVAKAGKNARLELRATLTGQSGATAKITDQRVRKPKP